MTEIKRQAKVVGHTPAVEKAAQVDEIRKSVYAQAEAAPDTIANGQVELQLKNGLKVVMGPPKTGVMLALAKIMDSDSSNQMLYLIAKALMYVRAIDDEKQEIPRSMVEIQALCNRLGPVGEEEVFLAYNEYWPTVTTADLQVIKKNL